ncbi:Lysine-specific demethylase 3A, variant 2 [Clonorchis sinensis]|uniref:Lysine-specific demethylase 3A, variant 2 n=2 Tax=Clonorchis sinensis TaxID=79923 RepID=A0A8T1MEL8_CLOSI|nr:Lysine-specific demethylase 3A, variant 2 [Clonorchis sinensis]GAA48942.1 jumonji domain-containing protein 1 [Clonorchis sinensis]
MLHKKKRWTAAIHATGQPPIPVLLPTATSPNCQWISHPPSSSPGARLQPRLPTPPAANQMNNQIPSAHSYSGDNVPPVSINAHLTPARSNPVESSQLTSKPQTPSNRPSVCNEVSGPSTTPINRNDLSSNLIAAITNSPELLQQSGLLLHILPQEYIEKYTKSLEKRNNTNKSAYDSGTSHNSLTGQSSDIGARAGSNEGPGAQISPPLRASQPSSRPSSTDFPQVFRTTSPSNFVYQVSVPRSSTIDVNRVAPRTTLGPRLVTPQAPIYSSSTTPSTQQQSPHRRLSGSAEGLVSKGGWGTSLQHPASQQPQLPSLDYSTISAVARAASLLHSSSRMNSAAALLSQWDPATQLALLSQVREGVNRADNFDQKQSVTSLTSYPATPPVSSSLTVGGYHPTSTSMGNPLIGRVFGSQQDLPKLRNQIDVSPHVTRVHTPSNQNPTADVRRQTPKPAMSQARQPDSRLPPPGSANVENLKSFRDTPPWLSTDGRSEQNVHVNPVVEAADARLSILQDAKLAALSVEWPALNSACQSSAQSKTQRARSSTSSSPGLPAPGTVPMSLPPTISQTTALHPIPPRCTMDAKEIKRISPNSYAPELNSPGLLSRTRQVTPGANQTELPNATKPATPGGYCGTTQVRHHVTPSPTMAPLASSLGVTATENPNVFNRQVGSNVLPTPGRPSDEKSPRPTVYPGVSLNALHKMMNSPTGEPILHTSGSGCEMSFPWPPPKGYESQLRRLSTPSDTTNPGHLKPSLDEDEAHKSSRTPTETRSTAMPLKKRLIQRYEADNGTTIGTCSSNLSTISATSPDLTRYMSAGPKLSPHSPLRSDNSFISGVDQPPSGSHERVRSAGKSSEKSEHPGIAPKKRKPNKGRNLSDVSDGSWEKKPSGRCVSASGMGNKHAGGSRDPRKRDGSTTRRSDSYAREPKISKSKARTVKSEDSGNISDQKTRKQTQRRTRQPSSDASSAQSSSRLDDGDEPPRRRMAAVNGTYLMMVASRAHRSHSSASSASSSSLRSVEAGVESDFDQTVDETTKSSKAPKSYARTKMEKVHHSCDSTDSTNDAISDGRRTGAATQAIQHDRVRKPKRAAALAASAATAASATVGMKRPRLSSTHMDLMQQPSQHQVTDREDEEVDADDESMSTDGASSIMTLDPKGPTTSSILDELSAALTEDKLPFEELMHQIPGPPDLQQLTDHSLRPTHSLDHYRRSRTAFVQLVSCNDPGLKQIPKCRACRQLKRSHVDNSTSLMMNGGMESSLSDEEGRSGEQRLTTSSTTGVNGAAQFKRPSGRNGHTEKGNKEGSGDNNDRVNSGDKQRGKKTTTSSPVSVFCRFWGFRKLIFNNRGILKIAGFCHSNEAAPIDRSLWEMYYPVSPCVDPANAKYLLERAGVLFCRLLRQEVAILTGYSDREPIVHRGPGAPPKNGIRRGNVAANATAAALGVAVNRGHPANVVAWKRPVKGVREMCDVCETTMFNTHWVCAKCGYSVCVHCCEEARVRKNCAKSEFDGEPRDVNPVKEKNKGKQPRSRAGPPGWASCTTTRQHHDPDRLVLTSLLPASTIGKLLHQVHRISRHYQIRMGCDCLSPTNSQTKQSESRTTLSPTSENSLDLLADLALKTDSKMPKSVEQVERVENGLYGMERIAASSTGVKSVDPITLPPHTWIRKPEPASHGGENSTNDVPDPGNQDRDKYRVLQLHDADSTHTSAAFQREWRANRPVVISGCHTKFSPSLWTPRSFTDEFGPLRTTLVDCATGIELTRYPLRTFWDGFERKARRLVSKDGRALCLKLKDWPTTDDFAELQPHRFNDLMTNLPMPEYTRRDGQLNLAARLNSFFVCPDLGPKLYVAYGTGGSRSIGTTNLHVDIADAINLLLYVGHPSDSVEESNANAEAVLNVMRQANVDPVYLERAMNWTKQMQYSNGSTWTGTNSPTSNGLDVGPPGALWHIFLPKDMPALREFLTQITEEETGAPLEPGSDPIHDQLFYLDQPLLDRLYASTGVLPCTLVQFTGDAIFIPAGAAHQVRNLNSCIKAAVDFVSPEHLPQCFQLIEQFRRLSATHQNHEDKLQVKNMLFHAVKDALSVLLVAGDSQNDRKVGTVEKPEEEAAGDQPLMNRLGQLFDPNQATPMMNASLLPEEETIEFEPLSRTGPTDSDTVERSVNASRRSLVGPPGSGGSKGRPGRPKNMFSVPGKISPSCKSSPDSDSFRSAKLDSHVLNPPADGHILPAQSSSCTPSISSCNRSPVMEDDRVAQMSTDEALQT